ncbi:hypothetical protein E2I00_015821, partial [Balaenoptera physalus]
EDGARKLVGLLGTEASPDGDTTADKIFRYIPGTNIPTLESQQENLEQPFLSVFKAGQRRAPDISDCYLELFPSHLYFQAHGSEGLIFQVRGSGQREELGERERAAPWEARGPVLLGVPQPFPPAVLWQGLLPLMELSVCPLEGSREHAFQITAPPQVSAGNPTPLSTPTLLLLPLTPFYQGPPENELPWTLQHRLTPLRTASGLQVVGTAVCASRVKLQHLPSQVGGGAQRWEEAGERCRQQGELPLSAIHINLAERDKQIRSFLIEGRLINTIRVVCASYEDYGHWLLCLQTVVGSGRGSLSSDGRTSWDSGCPAAASSRSTPESAAGCPARPAPEQASPGCTSVGGHKAKLRRASSNRSPRSKAQGKGPGPGIPLHLDLTKLRLEDGPEAPDHSLETPHSPLYADPYTPPATSHRRVTDIQDLDKKGVLQARASQRHRGSIKGRGSRPPGSPQLTAAPQGATTVSGTKLCHLPTSGGLEHLRLKAGSSSGSDGHQEAASRDHLPASTLQEGLKQGLGLFSGATGTQYRVRV